MCASCMAHLLADSRLKDETATCPNCRCEISKSLCIRNLAVEKAISELPATCQYCSKLLPRSQLAHHEHNQCLDRCVLFTRTIWARFCWFQVISIAHTHGLFRYMNAVALFARLLSCDYVLWDVFQCQYISSSVSWCLTSENHVSIITRVGGVLRHGSVACIFRLFGFSRWIVEHHLISCTIWCCSGSCGYIQFNDSCG